ncbi:hypothetical protein GYMLUDRAFT_250788 [Collybiopsis luxurians FD-317 M1]|uniref:Uncharacterized protein n=1 Tax=Collybiopsis luxurians FD-317 M1 TaxID=944289 RepID=A0A0D0CDD3_9AGAR|nr:hypothetical protein GYMLUDRAFT_250788 [Collybiopsis luxurians FD-317 M1]
MFVIKMILIILHTNIKLRMLRIYFTAFYLSSHLTYAAVARFSSSAGAAAAARFSSSAIGQDDTSSQPAFTSCSTIVSSNPDLSGNVQNATNDFQLAEVKLLENEYPQSFADELVELITYTIQPNGDGTGIATTVFLIGEVTNANLTSFVQSWDGLTANGPKAVWTIGDVTCTVARVTCNSVTSPTPAVSNITDAGNDLLDAEGLQVVNQFPFETGFLFDNDAIVANADGSYNITSYIQVGNVTSDQLIPFANSWVGETISGEEAQGLVEAGSCFE